MPTNLNETECQCMGIYNEANGSCDIPPNGVDPCPDSGGSGFWNNLAGANWNAISENALQWGYALGILKPPSTNLQTQAYMMELQKQRQQMMYIMVFLGVLMLVIVIMVLRQGKKK